ncbi:hypothetical protein [Spiroplasma sp. AdecLV25b]|uniref:hypothetical protein n=1 Tax=Spiroplasma sp. AdecLV25b TaxID=3027162 RepID=UPI0027E1339D|nr:hypothetical protein [Spiroplasma sp. AdecLV25b]
MYLSSNVTKKLTNALDSAGAVMAMYSILASYFEILPELQPMIIFLLMDMIC